MAVGRTRQLAHALFEGRRVARLLEHISVISDAHERKSATAETFETSNTKMQNHHQRNARYMLHNGAKLVLSTIVVSGNKGNVYFTGFGTRDPRSKQTFLALKQVNRRELLWSTNGLINLEVIMDSV